MSAAAEDDFAAAQGPVKLANWTWNEQRKKLLWEAVTKAHQVTSQLRWQLSIRQSHHCTILSTFCHFCSGQWEAGSSMRELLPLETTNSSSTSSGPSLRALGAPQVKGGNIGPGRGARIYAQVANVFPANAVSKDDLRNVYNEVCMSPSKSNW